MGINHIKKPIEEYAVDGGKKVEIPLAFTCNALVPVEILPL